MLEHSRVLNDILERRAPQVNFTMGEHIYNTGNYLINDIYPELTTFFKFYALPQDLKFTNFTKH